MRTKMPRKNAQYFIESLYPDFPKPSQIKTFNAQFGKTISSWQLVEAQLYEVYRSITCAERPGAEAAAFYSVGTFRTQLNLTNAAVQFALHDDKKLLAEWTTLYNQSTKKSTRRNEIAHGMIWHQFNEKNKERKIYVGPAISDPRDKIPKQKGNKPEPITLKRIKAYEKDFRALAANLRKFAARIPRPLMPPPLHAQTQDDPPIRAIRSRPRTQA